MKIIQRACGALIREDRILMVLHRTDGCEYWTLPGGEIEPGETPEQAVIREFEEETGLAVSVHTPAFDEDMVSGHICRCFFLHETDPTKNAALGFDPEDRHLSKQDKMLQDIRWFSLSEMREDKQVSLIIKNKDKGIALQ